MLDPVVQAAKKEREEANEKLGELQSNAEDFVKLQKQLKQESSRADKLQVRPALNDD